MQFPVRFAHSDIIKYFYLPVKAALRHILKTQLTTYLLSFVVFNIPEKQLLFAYIKGNELFVFKSIQKQASTIKKLRLTPKFS